MRALVLGATGHIGAHIVRSLLYEGHSVRAAYRNQKYLNILDDLPVEKVRVDLLTQEGLYEAAVDCDWVFQAAGYYPRFGGSRKEAVELGMQTTRRILDVLQKVKPSRIIFTSSAATIKHLGNQEATEADVETWPLESERTLYSTVKIAMEYEILEGIRRGLPIIITKPSICIGEYDAHKFSGMAVLLYAKYRLPFYLNHRINVVYTGDVGAAHVRAAKIGKIGDSYLLTRQSMMLRDFAHLVAKCAGVRPPWLQVPYPLALTAAWGSQLIGKLTKSEPRLSPEVIRSASKSQSLDGNKAVRELEMPQTSVDEAVIRAITWFQENGYLNR